MAIDIEPGEPLYAIEATEYPTDMPAGSIEHLMHVLGLVADHRYFQDMQWGGPAHDDGHTPIDWELIFGSHIRRLTDYDGNPTEDYPARLLKIAAVAVAAYQAWDRAQARVMAEG
ncbi:MAG: hypothetical protein M0006_03430 [Magnetospirillum sp.]|nr:hypothetical protein [Magnetospirillum sp.]